MFKRSKSSRKPTIGKGRMPPEGALSHLFHGIAVVPGSDACQAACTTAQQRFLSEEAPRLPLEGCDRRERCECRYKHYSDRRTDARRESDVGLPQSDHPEEKRNRVGRRITDG